MIFQHVGEEAGSAGGSWEWEGMRQGCPRVRSDWYMSGKECGGFRTRCCELGVRGECKGYFGRWVGLDCG